MNAVDPRNPITEADIVLNPRETSFAPVDPKELFGNSNPVILEIGSGKGRFLISTAMERPDLNLLGIEKSLHYHRLIRDRVLKRGLRNVRLMNHDAFLILQKMLPDSSIAEVHIYFPDPWPRAKQQKRRIIRPEALAEMRRAKKGLAGVSLDVGPFVLSYGLHASQVHKLSERSNLKPGDIFTGTEAELPVVTKWETEDFVSVSIDLRAALKLLSTVGGAAAPQ